MLWTPKAPALAPRPLVEPLPRKLPVSLHPSCVLALLPQNDDKWFDYSGHGNHGIVHGATPTAKGPDGFAWEFDKANAHIDCGNDASLNITDAITQVVRIKPNWIDTSPRQILIRAWNINRIWATNINNLAIYNRISGHIAYRHVANAFPATDGTRCYQIVYSFNGSIERIYVDAIERLVVPISGDLETSTLPLLIGIDSDRASTPFRGLIDYVLIYNQAWSPRPQDANYLPEIDPRAGGF